MTIPTISINVGYFFELGSLPLPLMLWRLFIDGGWIPVLLIVLQGCWLMWVQWRQIKFASTVQTCLLAIDVPRMNEQTPKAVEQMFVQLAGAYSGLDNYEKFWLGKFQACFSLEVVSMEGYVQFLVHTWKKYRDLVEAAVYAQYPDAEITEVQDYTGVLPRRYPDENFDVWGTEFTLKKPFPLPIRTYPEFEHTASEEYFKDPLTPLLEVFSAIKREEYMWMQILIVPGDDSWKEVSKAFVDKIMGKKPVEKATALDAIMELPKWWIAETSNQIMGGATDGKPPAKPEKKDDGMKMMNMTPGERDVIEKIQIKATKVGFATKIRLIYGGRRGVFSKGRISQFKGAIGMFTAQDMNSLKPYGKVTPKEDYFYERWEAGTKKARILRHFRGRSGRGATPFYFNTEELATIFHFPFRTSKAPMVKKTDAKKAEPPAHLPQAEDEMRPKPFRPISKG